MQCRGSLLHGGSWEWYISASILGSIPGTEQDSFKRRERHAKFRLPDIGNSNYQ